MVWQPTLASKPQADTSCENEDSFFSESPTESSLSRKPSPSHGRPSSPRRSSSRPVATKRPPASPGSRLARSFKWLRRSSRDTGGQEGEKVSASSPGCLEGEGGNGWNKWIFKSLQDTAGLTEEESMEVRALEGQLSAVAEGASNAEDEMSDLNMKVADVRPCAFLKMIYLFYSCSPFSFAFLYILSVSPCAGCAAPPPAHPGVSCASPWQTVLQLCPHFLDDLLRQYHEGADARAGPLPPPARM